MLSLCRGSMSKLSSMRALHSRFSDKLRKHYLQDIFNFWENNICISNICKKKRIQLEKFNCILSLALSTLWNHKNFEIEYLIHKDTSKINNKKKIYIISDYRYYTFKYIDIIPSIVLYIVISMFNINKFYLFLTATYNATTSYDNSFNNISNSWVQWPLPISTALITYAHVYISDTKYL